LSKEGVFLGLDVGHINTKCVLMRDKKILYCGKESTLFDPIGSAQKAMDQVLNRFRISKDELSGIIITGIFRELVGQHSIDKIKTVSEYEAVAKGALFLDGNSRIVIDAGGNIIKVIHYDQKGELIDVVENDKCADGLGIFYTSMVNAFGLNEEEASDLALKSKRDISIAIQCVLSAELEARDLISQGIDISDVVSAILKFVAERIYSISTYMPLGDGTVMAGGLARSRALINHISRLMKKELKVLEYPEYVGAIGAVISYEGGK